MKAIVMRDEAAGPDGMTLVEHREPPAAINDVIVQIHASGFVPTEMEWPSTWTDRRGRDRTSAVPGHELAGVVTALGYGTTGVSVGQRVLGLADWHRDGTLAESVAIEARSLAPLPGDVDFTVGASLPISGLTAWQGLFDHGRVQAGRSVLAHGAAGAVGTMVTQLAREAGAYVIGTGRAADREKALDFGAHEFVDLDHDALEDVVDLVFDVIGGDIQKRSANLIRAGGTLVTIVGPLEARPPTAWQSTSSSSPIAPNWLRSSSGCATDDCGPTSAALRPSTMLSPPSTGPSDAPGRRSSAFVHKDSDTAASPENPGRRLYGRSDLSRSRRSPDARTDPTEALHGSAACTCTEPAGRGWPGRRRLLLRVSGRPEREPATGCSDGERCRSLRWPRLRPPAFGGAGVSA
jgi:NADPH:quinone reductase-like Zn-dependent oxidoreductase